MVKTFGTAVRSKMEYFTKTHDVKTIMSVSTAVQNGIFYTDTRCENEYEWANFAVTKVFNHFLIASLQQLV